MYVGAAEAIQHDDREARRKADRPLWSACAFGGSSASCTLPRNFAPAAASKDAVTEIAVIEQPRDFADQVQFTARHRPDRSAQSRNINLLSKANGK